MGFFLLVLAGFFFPLVDGHVRFLGGLSDVDASGSLSNPSRAGGSLELEPAVMAARPLWLSTVVTACPCWLSNSPPLGRGRSVSQSAAVTCLPWLCDPPRVGGSSTCESAVMTCPPWLSNPPQVDGLAA